MRGSKAKDTWIECPWIGQGVLFCLPRRVFFPVSFCRHAKLVSQKGLQQKHHTGSRAKDWFAIPQITARLPGVNEAGCIKEMLATGDLRFTGFQGG